MDDAGRVREILDRAGIPYALIGAMALAARGHVRATLDTDYLVTDRKALVPEIWSDLESAAVLVDIRKGDYDDPLAGVVRLHFPEHDIDVVVGKYKWQREIIERAQPADIGGAFVPLPSIADLIVLKLFAGGYQDLADVAALLSIGDRDAIVREVSERVTAAGKDAVRTWTDFVKRIS